ncbi:Putative Cytochrome C family protein [Candidatus Sulfobium mesophilum]|uniref:Cytochrome C family protein n=1 Tax=Candidatus Sulfobium mesophilum TaxID=2016548 RepID=A0A2U3QE96_9BACT|nr:Putative Cytochrome C family protein [Candidatus Sulfobium mesophilum]
MVLLMPPAEGNPLAFYLVEPSDMSIVSGKWVTVVIALNGEADRVVIVRNKNEMEDVSVSAQAKYLCRTIGIGIGLNEIAVKVTKGGSAIEAKKISVFCESGLLKKEALAPRQFQKMPFHRKEKEEVCRPCHNMESDGKDPTPDKPGLSLCRHCHERTISSQYVHGPVATWTCYKCHNKDSAPAKYVTLQPDSSLCFSCHTDIKAQWAQKKYVHGPTATGKCTICHSPHGSDTKFFLRKAPWNLCVSCHEEMGKNVHKFKLYALLDDGHPTRGVKDPGAPWRVLSCASCHNPHASNVGSFLSVDSGDMLYAFCNKCHNK